MPVVRLFQPRRSVEHAWWDERATTSALSAESLVSLPRSWMRTRCWVSGPRTYRFTTCRVWCFWVLYFVTLLPLPTLFFYVLVLLVDGHAATCVERLPFRLISRLCSHSPHVMGRCPVHGLAVPRPKGKVPA